MQLGVKETIKSQIKQNEHTNLTGNVLMLSNRLYHLAYELYLYIKQSNDANIIKVITSANDFNRININNIDYLIIVGYLV